ncbi:MAG: hypothetical protein JKX85_12360 [Phycisphaeraceae bacterium]|nr:hypothetical protein [Phycisphaeraceae bacterium]
MKIPSGVSRVAKLLLVYPVPLNDCLLISTLQKRTPPLVTQSVADEIKRRPAVAASQNASAFRRDDLFGFSYEPLTS